jgi:hypothetical protein
MSHRIKIFKKLYKSAQDNTQNKSTAAKTDQPAQSQQDKKNLESSISDAYNKASSGIGSAYGQLEGGVSSVLSYAFDKETADKIARWGTPALLGALFLSAYKYITTGNLKHAAIAGAIGAAVGISLKALLAFFGSRAATKTDQTTMSPGPKDYEKERVDEHIAETGYHPNFRDYEKERADEWLSEEAKAEEEKAKKREEKEKADEHTAETSPPSTLRDYEKERADEWLSEEAKAEEEKARKREENEKALQESWKMLQEAPGKAINYLREKRDAALKFLNEEPKSKSKSSTEAPKGSQEAIPPQSKPVQDMNDTNAEPSESKDTEKKEANEKSKDSSKWPNGYSHEFPSDYNPKIDIDHLNEGEILMKYPDRTVDELGRLDYPKPY